MIHIIVAYDNKNGFAKNKNIPWLAEEWCKQDLQRFKTLTDGCALVMGTNTYNEIASLRKVKKDLLPNRTSYVVTSKPEKTFPGATAISALSEVYKLEPNRDIFVIGGEKLYREAMINCKSVFVTYINKDYDCDQYFPVPINNWEFWDHSDEPLNEYVTFKTYFK
jgi:dihydrofolate reductase